MNYLVHPKLLRLISYSIKLYTALSSTRSQLFFRKKFTVDSTESINSSTDSNLLFTVLTQSVTLLYMESTSSINLKKVIIELFEPIRINLCLCLPSSTYSRMIKRDICHISISWILLKKLLSVSDILRYISKNHVHLHSRV